MRRESVAAEYSPRGRRSVSFLLLRNRPPRTSLLTPAPPHLGARWALPFSTQGVTRGNRRVRDGADGHSGSEVLGRVHCPVASALGSHRLGGLRRGCRALVEAAGVPPACRLPPDGTPAAPELGSPASSFAAPEGTVFSRGSHEQTRPIQINSLLVIGGHRCQ